jgi:hypothetical protein
MHDPRVWSAIAAALTTALVLLWARVWWRNTRGRFLARTRSRRARDGEKASESLLEDLGYEIVARQARGSIAVAVDGVELEIGLRADLIATRNGLRYVAEAKTGTFAPRIETPATRRQLLEYRIAFDVDGVLLVDPEAGRVREVVFPRLLEPARSSAWRWVIPATLVAAAAAAIWVMR